MKKKAYVKPETAMLDTKLQEYMAGDAGITTASGGASEALSKKNDFFFWGEEETTTQTRSRSVWDD